MTEQRRYKLIFRVLTIPFYNIPNIRYLCCKYDLRREVFGLYLSGKVHTLRLESISISRAGQWTCA